MTSTQKQLDLAFAIDCTGSMGSYITEARENVEQIVNAVVASEKCEVNLALVEYRDHPPEDTTFVTRKHDFTDSARTMKSWLHDCSATGGGDTPEAVADALKDVLDLSWREDATKMCVLIADAPPHGFCKSGDHFPDGCPLGYDPMEITKQIAGKGICLYVVGCEPSICEYKDFYLALAHIATGQYVPLKEAKGISKVILYSSIEEMSLRKLEDEVVGEIMQMKSSGIAIDEKVLASSMHQLWKKRGEKTKQLTVNSRGLEGANSSDLAMKMANSGFNDAKTLFDSSGRSKSNPKGSSGGDEKSKHEAVTKALAGIKPLSGSKVNVDLGNLADTVDFGPANAEGEEYQCIDGGVTFEQTMRVVNRSLHKSSSSSKK